jgi:hypothetical protein
MAVEVYAIKITSGVRFVETAGGWIPLATTGGKILAAVERAVSSLTAPMQSLWQDYEDMHVVFESDGSIIGGAVSARNGNAEPSGSGDPSDPAEPDPAAPKKRGRPPKQKPEPSQGGSAAPSPSGGMNPDEYVTHDEFDPWQAQTDNRVAEMENRTDLLAEKCGDLDAVLFEARADLTAVDMRVAKVESTVETLKRRVADAVEQASKRVSSGNEPFTLVLNTGAAAPVPKIVGGTHHNEFQTLLRLIATGQHTYLPGPPGSGKSHSAESAAKALGWEFASLSLGPTTPESRIWGGRDANNNFHEPDFVRGARFAMDNPDSGFVFCLDEMDNGHGGIIATLNSALANGWFSAPNGDRIVWGRNFVAVACANTFGTGPTAEFAGRNKLDAATLDRFAYLPWETDFELERTMVHGILHDQPVVAADWLDCWVSARNNVTSHGLKVFVTMRGALAGARMLANGFTITEAMSLTLLNKLPKDQAEKVSPL